MHPRNGVFNTRGNDIRNGTLLEGRRGQGWTESSVSQGRAEVTVDARWYMTYPQYPPPPPPGRSAERSERTPRKDVQRSPPHDRLAKVPGIRLQGASSPNSPHHLARTPTANGGVRPNARLRSLCSASVGVRGPIRTEGRPRVAMNGTVRGCLSTRPPPLTRRRVSFATRGS